MHCPYLFHIYWWIRGSQGFRIWPLCCPPLNSCKIKIVGKDTTTEPGTNTGYLRYCTVPKQCVCITGCWHSISVVWFRNNLILTKPDPTTRPPKNFHLQFLYLKRSSRLRTSITDQVKQQCTRLCVSIFLKNGLELYNCIKIVYGRYRIMRALKKKWRKVMSWKHPLEVML